MVKSTQTASRAELQRRPQQSLKDRELRRRREQSARDRARHERELLQQARTTERLTRVLTQYICSSIGSAAHIPNPLVSLESITMPTAFRPSPWTAESDSGRAFDR